MPLVDAALAVPDEMATLAEVGADADGVRT
jgi:hypothetical protein